MIDKILNALELSRSGDSKSLTSYVPDILIKPRINADLVDAVISNRNDYILPEVFLLASMASLKQALPMVNKKQDVSMRMDLLRTTSHIGRYNFSFPIWRFLSQSFNGASLIERFGFERMERPTDVRDETLPKSNPDRDRLGIGFVHTNDEWYIEYRRSYILISSLQKDNAATLLIRNSSYFYGRDRLEFPAYVSFKKLKPQQLSSLDEDTISNEHIFTPWHKYIEQSVSLDQFAKVHFLLKKIDESNVQINDWLLGKTENSMGVNELKQALSYFNETLCSKGMPIHLCGINGNRPPWYPHASLQITSSLIDHFNIDDVTKRLDVGKYQFAILSGANGDFPVKPETLEI